LAHRSPAGDASVDPKRILDVTCRYCGLETLCRVFEKSQCACRRGARRVAVLKPMPDQAQRDAALDPRRSFIVQAPAGSGKLSSWCAVS